jgi:Zn finger protein HypA/HybF involved in hydrogenase expression
MHDLMTAKDISEAVQKKATENDLKKVTEIVVDLGEMEDHGEIVSEENLKFHLNYLLKGTLAEKAKLVFKKVKTDTIILREIEGE